MVDFLDSKRREIEERLKELRPLVDEYTRLEKAATALAGVQGQSNGGPGRTTSRPGRTLSLDTSSARTSAAPSTRPRAAGRGRPKGGKRGQQALQHVKDKPGITIAELADAMGIKANYLYRVMPALAAEGQVAKRDGGWHPA
jgi:hypothetical protein